MRLPLGLAALAAVLSFLEASLVPDRRTAGEPPAVSLDSFLAVSRSRENVFSLAEGALPSIVAGYEATACADLLRAVRPIRMRVVPLEQVAEDPVLLEGVLQAQRGHRFVNAVTKLNGRTMYVAESALRSESAPALLFHEYLHGLGWSDEALQSLFCRAGAGEDTHCISQGLRRLCPLPGPERPARRPNTSLA